MYIRPALTRVVLVIFVVGGVVAVSGCYDPRIRPCAVTCATESDCTGDQTCRGGVCQGPSDSCPTGGDADVDGPDDGDGGIDAMPTGTWREMSVGAFHTCAIKSADGALFCWGNNDHRQIGVASPIRTGTLSPVSAGAQTTGWEHVAAGWWHTCATRADGSLWCWGKNDSMQCGQASSPFASPARVNDPAGLSGTRWTAVTVGASFTCALRDDGTLWCFGGGGSGQLGQGTVDASSQLPARVGTRTDWRAVDAGFTHACGIYKPSGERARIACWGNDASQGRLGDGNVGMNRYVPTDVADNGASDWQSLSASDYATCAIEAAGQLWCWGDQYHVPGGVLSTTPTRFGTVTGYDRVSLGAFGGCFVLDGTVLCYGYNYDGAVGYPPTSGTGTPSLVGGVTGVTEIGAGAQHSCALDGTGVLSCWGDRGDGQLGDDIIGDPHVPAEVLENHHPWRDVWVSTEHTCAVTMAGAMWCWGDNWSGQLGGGFAMGQYYELPIAVAATGTFDRMSNGYAHSCGLDSTTNQLWCWGNNDYGQRGGVAPSNYDPISISGTTLTELASGYHVNCGVTTGGARRCWGLNDSAQIGNGGTSVPVTTPTTVTEALSSWTRLAMGEQHGCGLAAGALHCWGYNSAGQTGQTAGASPVTAPAAVADPTPGTTDSWIALSGGALHTCGVLSTNGTSGQIYCWGYNGRGQLGFGGSGGATLVAISSPTDFVEVAAGYAHTCGRRATGQLHCWGSNDQGELGDNTVYERASIGTPIAGASDWVAVDVGQYISCGIRGADRRLYCWGENRYGQAGTGGTLRWMPGPVNAP